LVYRVHTGTPSDLEPAHVEEILQKRENGNVEVAAHFKVTEVLSTNQRARKVEVNCQSYDLNGTHV